MHEPYPRGEILGGIIVMKKFYRRKVLRTNCQKVLAFTIILRLNKKLRV